VLISSERKLVLETVKKVCRELLWPLAPEYDQSRAFPWPQLKELGRLGLLGMTTPEEWGGVGLDSVTWALALEEIAAADPSVAVILSVTSGLPQYMLLRFGNDEQKRKYLVPLASGEWIGAFCLTEPHAGSDPASLKTQARSVPGGFVLNGTKSWITSAGQADLYLIMAHGEEGICAFLLEKGTPGLSFGHPEEKMGLHAAHSASVYLEDVFIPQENLLGVPGKGLAQALAGLDSGRIGIAAQAVGMARAAFEIAKDYAAERTQFGRPIREFQGVSFKLADMHVRIAAARALTHEAARKRDAGERFTLEASSAKLFASETAVMVTGQAVQILGGYGYHRDYRVERYYRDAKVTEIYEGTSEIQRLVISRELYR
jgi:alkylation response protein AidB-like acyl-CoA dehydrogenase